MKILIFSDMEGCSGICLRSQVEQTGARYAEGRRYMTSDINACIRGCLNGGAEKIVVRDVHAGCFNAVWEELDDRAEYIAGIPGRLRFEGADEFDGIILLGYHAMAGTPRAILEHTSSRTWQNCWLNGEKVGEVALDAARAGEHEVPVIMVSGDDKLCSEAKALLGEVETVQVKTGYHLESGKLLSQAVAHRKIREGAEKAVRNCRNARPFMVTPPITLKVELIEREQVPSSCRGNISGNDRTCEVTGKSVEEAVMNLLMD